MQLRTIQRADLIVAILAPPAVILAIINGRLTLLLMTAAAVAAMRAVFIRSVVTALKAGQAQPRARLAAVHDLDQHRNARDAAEALES